MKLISCDNCAVVFDADKLKFPEDIRDNNAEVISDRAILDGSDWVAKVDCPICNFPITQPNSRDGDERTRIFIQAMQPIAQAFDQASRPFDRGSQ